jgi:hypothetical protein
MVTICTKEHGSSHARLFFEGDACQQGKALRGIMHEDIIAIHAAIQRVR